ncbi:hypothetical protein CUJ84_Chr004497 [Rhizobium leguminosarum]|uniref:Uncharacterized protein n=1 Tax=Rhizobium leguminosarum TaxID=384 RepID=A0A2K9Z987_RHILE|nr:hypothetical protein CUJ84_Chr004497 [Rhizobium leguminosarum]
MPRGKRERQRLLPQSWRSRLLRRHGKFRPQAIEEDRLHLELNGLLHHSLNYALQNAAESFARLKKCAALESAYDYLLLETFDVNVRRCS